MTNAPQHYLSRIIYGGQPLDAGDICDRLVIAAYHVPLGKTGKSIHDLAVIGNNGPHVTRKVTRFGADIAAFLDALERLALVQMLAATSARSGVAMDVSALEDQAEEQVLTAATMLCQTCAQAEHAQGNTAGEHAWHSRIRALPLTIGVMTTAMSDSLKEQGLAPLPERPGIARK